MKRLFFALFLGVFVFLAGCGGGGGEPVPPGGGAVVRIDMSALADMITWSSDGTACTARDSWEGPRSVGGSETVVVSGLYTLECTRNGSTATAKSVMVEIPLVVPPVVVPPVVVPPVVYPFLEVGTLLHPCLMAMCSKDLSTGLETVLWGAYNKYPFVIVPYRGNRVAFLGGNIGGVVALSLPDLVNVGGTGRNGFIAGNCSLWPNRAQFDIAPSGDFVVMASKCFVIGVGEKTDIFLVKMDGSGHWSRVTDDNADDSSPVIAGVDPLTGEVTVFFVRNGEEIWKKTINPVTDAVGPATLIVAGVVSGVVRTMSVSPDGSAMAVMKEVGGKSHIFIMPTGGGVGIDMGPGRDPHWSLDGIIMFSFGGDYSYGYGVPRGLWAIKPDGSDRRRVPVPVGLFSFYPWDTVFVVRVPGGAL